MRHTNSESAHDDARQRRRSGHDFEERSSGNEENVFQDDRDSTSNDSKKISKTLPKKHTTEEQPKDDKNKDNNNHDSRIDGTSANLEHEETAQRKKELLIDLIEKRKKEIVLGNEELEKLQHLVPILSEDLEKKQLFRRN